MKPYVKLYLDSFGYGISDFIPSEISGYRAVDINHIDCKGMGGSKDKDYIENLIALTRIEHEMFGDKKEYRNFIVDKHVEFMQFNGVPVDFEKINKLKYG